jgi:hypothetical protein
MVKNWIASSLTLPHVKYQIIDSETEKREKNAGKNSLKLCEADFSNKSRNA